MNRSQARQGSRPVVDARPWKLSALEHPPVHPAGQALFALSYVIDSCPVSEHRLGQWRCHELAPRHCSSLSDTNVTLDS